MRQTPLSKRRYIFVRASAEAGGIVPETLCTGPTRTIVQQSNIQDARLSLHVRISMGRIFLPTSFCTSADRQFPIYRGVPPRNRRRFDSFGLLGPKCDQRRSSAEAGCARL